MFPSYVLSSVQWIHPFLSRFIPENKLLASVLCFQKTRLLFTNDLYFFNYNMSTFAVFLSFSFLFHFYIFIKLYTYGPLWRNLSLYIYTLIHDKIFLYTHWNSLSLRHMIKPYLHSKIFFVFLQHTPMAHTKVSLYTFVAHTHKNFSPRITYTHKTFYTHFPFTYRYIYKNTFSFLYEHDFYSQRFSLFIRIFGSFYF